MRLLHVLLAMFTLSLVCACAAPSTPTPTPETTSPIYLVLTLAVTDVTTDMPVNATVWLDDVQYGPLSELSVRVPFTGSITVSAQAPGYEAWSLTFNGHFVRDKEMFLPVRLKPLGQLF